MSKSTFKFKALSIMGMAISTCLISVSSEVEGQNLISNPGFEVSTPLVAAASYEANPIVTSWTTIGSVDAHHKDLASILDGKKMGGFGNQHLDLNGSTASVEQTITGLDKDSSYIFTFYTAQNVNITGSTWMQSAVAVVRDGASNTLILSDTWTYGIAERGIWEKRSIKFKASGTSVKLILQANGGSTSQHGILVDETSLTAMWNKSNSIGKIGVANSLMLVYPNPSEGEINIRSTANQLVNINVTDANGKSVKQVENINSDDYIMNCRDLSKGLYFINIFTSDKQLITEKVILF